MKKISPAATGRIGTTGRAGSICGNGLATLDRLMPCLNGMGISRLGDLTALDRIGIPVVQAVRPLGLANATTQGKGADLPSAAISAIMEAAEQFFAERIDRFRPFIGTAKQLGVPHERFASHAFAEVSASWHSIETAWVETADLITGQSAWLPLELAHTFYSETGLPTDGLFMASTTGLACAFEEKSALIHGLLECIERGAIAEAHRTHGFFQRFRVGPIEDADDELNKLLDKVRSAGMLYAFWCAPAVGNIPVLWCQVMEDGSQPLISPYPSDGFAADMDPIRAAKSALVEAAQSRLAAISGARDDLTRSSFSTYTDWSLIEAHRRLLAEGPASILVESLDDHGAPHMANDAEHLIERLVDGGITSILYFRYDTDPYPEINATRVILPELLPFTEY